MKSSRTHFQLKFRLFIILTMLLLPNIAMADEPDWTDYSHLLQHYVHTDKKHGIALHVVDYQSLAKDKTWPKLLTSLAQFDTATLKTKNEKLAFWINTYNILAIDMVLRNSPLQSIRDVGNFFSPVWKKDAGVVAGEMRTLNAIEHHILRPMHEPRIHIAIVCASVSCPDLKTTAYDADHLDEQLDHQARLFVRQTDKGVRIDNNSLHVSKIFDWFEDDFQSYGGMLGFIRSYRNDIKADMQIDAYLHYDWSLNAPTKP